jgi:hypothetical protein
MTNEDISRCGICKIPCFERNNYYYGKLMTVRDFLTEQDYFNEKRWLINRTVSGWGVVCGLDIKPKENDTSKVIVTPGLAIDCCGREILVCEEQVVSLKPEGSLCNTNETGQGQDQNGKLMICLKFHECKTEPIQFPPIACDQKEKCEFNRIRDSFKIRVIPFSEQTGQIPFCPQTKEDKEKSLHRYLCDRLRENCPTCPESLCIILAIVTVDKDGNLEGEPDTCSRRKLVYNNPMLYSLIHCFHGDLPRVSDISWKHNGTLSWNDFGDLIGQGLIVTFDKPMDTSTINIHTFLIAAITLDETTGYRLLRYIPGSINVKDIIKDNKNVGTAATFNFEMGWVNHEVKSEYSAIEDGTEFEIVLRGSSIFSKEGKSLDGSFKGDLPSGYGTQGIDFISWFSVEPKKPRTT